MPHKKCEKCNEKYTIVLKHRIYVRFYDNIKGKIRHRYIKIGFLCPKCLNIELDTITPQLFD